MNTVVHTANFVFEFLLMGSRINHRGLIYVKWIISLQHQPSAAFFEHTKKEMFH